MELATAKDLDAVAGMHAEAAGWLAAKGVDQWQPTAVGERTADVVRHRIAETIANQTCWLAYQDKDLVGTITVDVFADPEFWTEEDDPSDAVYVHRMIVRRRFAGQGIGRMLLSAADALARHAGRHWVRLDAWSTNADLHAYYQSLDFRHVRTLRYTHRGSGALFQRPVPQVDVAVTSRPGIVRPLSRE